MEFLLACLRRPLSVYWHIRSMLLDLASASLTLVVVFVPKEGLDRYVYVRRGANLLLP